MEFGTVHAAFPHDAQNPSLVLVFAARDGQQPVLMEVVLSPAGFKVLKRKNIHLQLLTGLSHAVFSLCHGLSADLIPLGQ